MIEYIEYTVEDEDANCIRCIHVNAPYKFCEENCGSEHGWCGYRRCEKVGEQT